MLRLLHARECGLETYGLDDVLHARWTRLQPDYSRHLRPLTGNEGMSVLDIDTPLGMLILCGGRNEVDPITPEEGALTLFRYPELGSKADSRPLVWGRAEDLANSPVAALKWFPNDAALFVSGAQHRRTVEVWDTERFTVATRFALSGEERGGGGSANGGFDSGVCRIAASSHPGGRPELMAVACKDLAYVTLVDLDSGTAAHVLQPDRARAPVRDAEWSPTNPHLLAAADAAGRVFLFDVRRSGAVACLLTMDDRSAPLPLVDAPSTVPPPLQRARTTSASASRKRLHDCRQKPSFSKQAPSSLSRPPPPPTLGLSCAWRGLSDRRRESLRRAPPSASVRKEAPSTCVRFTPDGSTVISAPLGKPFLTHDVLTGRLVSKFRGAALPNSTPDDEASIFEIARDGDHIITTCQSSLCCLDVQDGGIVHLSNFECHGQSVRDFVLHPVEEEVVGVRAAGITCWSDPNRDASSSGRDE